MCERQIPGTISGHAKKEAAGVVVVVVAALLEALQALYAEHIPLVATTSAIVAYAGSQSNTPPGGCWGVRAGESERGTEENIWASRERSTASSSGSTEPGLGEGVASLGEGVVMRGVGGPALCTGAAVCVIATYRQTARGRTHRQKHTRSSPSLSVECSSHKLRCRGWWWVTLLCCACAHACVQHRSLVFT